MSNEELALKDLARMQDFIAPQLKAEFLALRDAAFIKDVVLERRIDNLKELFTQMEGVSDPQLQSKIKEECVRLASSVQEMRFLVPLEWFPCKEDGAVLIEASDIFDTES